MPQPETASLEQLAVLWPITGLTGDGNALLGAPVEIAARYETTRRLSPRPDGKPVSKLVTVYVDRDIEEDSQMWLGALADLPNPLTKLMKVIDYDEVTDIKNNTALNAIQRTVTLMRL